jgi:hypothetical protein
LEDLKKKVQFSPDSPNLPLVAELPVWDNGNFLSDEEIKRKILFYKSIYPANKQVGRFSPLGLIKTFFFFFFLSFSNSVSGQSAWKAG